MVRFLECDTLNDYHANSTAQKSSHKFFTTYVSYIDLSIVPLINVKMY